MQQILSPADSQRALRTLRKLALLDVSRWVLAGALAVELHCLRGGHAPRSRHFSDIDFVAPDFDCIPETLAREFLFRHVHPLDPPGKTMMQLVDAATSLLIDLFRANQGIVSRAIPSGLPSGPLALISIEDAIAHTARLLLDLDAGRPVPAKHASDYLRLRELVQPSSVETVWGDHRKPVHPDTFGEADLAVRRLVEKRGDLLIVPEYSRDAAEVCPRCVATTPFPLADPKIVLSLLGYC